MKILLREGIDPISLSNNDIEKFVPHDGKFMFVDYTLFYKGTTILRELVSHLERSFNPDYNIQFVLVASTEESTIFNKLAMRIKEQPSAGVIAIAGMDFHDPSATMSVSATRYSAPIPSLTFLTEFAATPGLDGGQIEILEKGLTVDDGTIIHDEVPYLINDNHTMAYSCTSDIVRQALIKMIYDSNLHGFRDGTGIRYPFDNVHGTNMVSLLNVISAMLNMQTVHDDITPMLRFLIDGPDSVISIADVGSIVF